MFPMSKKMMLPIPILFTIPNFITAGSGQVLVNIVERLDRKKFSPTICVLKKGGALESKIEKLRIPLLESPFSIPALPYISLLPRAWKIANFFRPYGFKLWHSFHYSDDYTEPIISYFSGAKAWIYTKKAMGWGSRAWLVRSYLAKKIVADNSEMPLKMFDRIGLRHKPQIIHHGVPTGTFTPECSSTLGLRQRFGLAPSNPLVGCVANLLPVKGQHTLIQATAKIPSMHLFLAGKALDKDYSGFLQQLAENTGVSHRVHFLGDIGNIPEFLSELDVLVLPTLAKYRMEGCPVALLEAMASGKACVATNIPGSRDLVQDGECGLLVEPENPDQLSQAISRILDNPELKNQLEQNARRQVLQHFTIEKEVAAHEALYGEILGI